MDDDGPKFSKLGMHAVMIFTMHDSLQVPSDSVSTPHHFFNSLIFSATFRFSSILIWAFNALTSAESFFLPLFFTGAGKLGLDACMQLWIFVSKIFSAMTMAMSIYRTLCVLVFDTVGISVIVGVREDIIEKSTFSFGHCPKRGGGVYPCPNFLALFSPS